jgi:mono/diheme cytochrome c family protein
MFAGTSMAISVTRHFNRLAVVVGWVALFVAASVVSGQAAEPGDAHKGFDYAKSICAPCHAIEAGQKRSPVKAATPFEVFANTPGVNRIALLVFLQTPHATMPNLIVTGDDADNVIAYLLSLKKAN